MKYNTLIFFLTFIAPHLYFNFSFGQISFPTNNENNEVEFVKVLELDSMSKKDVFNTSKLWIANYFKSANDVIQFENIDDGKIVGKGNFRINSTGMGIGGTIHETQSGTVSFTFEISAKDNKCRIIIHDI